MSREEGTMTSVVRPKMCGVGAIDDDAGGGAEIEAEENEDEETGTRTTRKLPDPMKPSQAEVLEHRKTHLPYRNWCRHCARGRGTEMPHLKSKDEHSLPEVHLDFGFLGEEGEPGNTLPVLVVRERWTRMTMSSATPSKSTGGFIAKRVVAFLREIGAEQGDLIVKSDQEPAIMSIVTEIGRIRAAAGGGKFIVENSPVGSSASNGVVERAIRSVEQQTRVLKSGLEERWGVKIPTRHSVMPWLVEYAGLLLNRFEVSRDGKTSFERSKGKPAKTLGLEFGESVLWKRRPVGGALAKLTCLWEDGIFLGIKGEVGGDHCGRFERRLEDEVCPTQAS